MSADGRITLDRPTEFGRGESWERRENRLIQLATRQHGVVSARQLRRLGFSNGGVSHRVATGRLHKVHVGIYAVGRPALSAEGRWMAAVLACGRGALLSYGSAATLHGLLRSAQREIDVTIPRRIGLSRPGLRIHRSTCLGPIDGSTAKGIPCTSVAHTLLDLAAIVPPAVLEKACERAEVLQLLDRAAVDELLNRARGQRGVRRLRAVLATGRGATRSELERRFVALCRRERLPHPAINEWLTVAGEEMQVDFIWREQRVIVETDGYSTHHTRQAFSRDRRRDRLLSLAGWRVFRFTWDDVTREPQHVTEVVRRLVLEAPP